jgi:hypothetical protein
MNGTSRSLLGLSLLAVVLGYGCKDDADEDPDGRAGRGGSAGTTANGGKAGKGGGAGSGGTGGTGRGGSSAQAGGAAGEGGGGAGETNANGGAGAAGVGGEGGERTGTAGVGGAGEPAGAAGEAASAGAGGTADEEDPRCTEIPVDATVTSHLKITADNECDVYVNGVSVGSTNNWGSAVTIDVSLYVHPGRKNVVAVVGRNTSSQDGNDRGIVGELTTSVGDTLASLIVTNAEWRVSQEPGEDWVQLGYDDSSWPFAAEIATVGEPPWGQVIANTDVKWIWFAPIPASTADKPNLEATYARRVFFFDFDGSASSEPLCNPPAP